MKTKVLELKINGKNYSIDIEANTSLLWAIREYVGLTGTKFGCGVAQCGACTVHLNGSPIKSCVYPANAAAGAEITTIEGATDKITKALQSAWIEEQVPQCGYCQSGQIMQATTLLQKNNSPTREEIVSHMNGVLCRCGTYYRIIKAIKRAAKEV